jgi:hypothetical protein
LLHALLPSGHFTKQAASPCRSPSESAPSWALASVVTVGAAIESTDKITAILRKSNIAVFSLQSANATTGIAQEDSKIPRLSGLIV